MSEAEDLARLRRLLEAGTVRLGVHLRRMNSPGSPVYRWAENVLPPGLVLVASLAATAFLHLWLGMAVVVAGAAWWLGRVQPRVKDGVFGRTTALALSGERQFDALWAAGVLSLYARLPDGEERAATRRDDWRAWVRALSEAAATPPAGPPDTAAP
ncbi:MAG TPA: hypothetical protein VE684_08505 [Crenalkalicoccus sp.]|jgi:hypothetical protein|nr:hypothetical protein [Crenalkalicoccus sp.]